MVQQESVEFSVVLGDFGHRQARKESQRYDLSAAWVNRLESCERGFKGEEILNGHGSPGFWNESVAMQFLCRESA